MLNELDMGGRLHPMSTQSEPTIALLSCHYLFEDFFDTIGVSLETLRTELTGGWMFNYIDALRVAGVRTVLIFVSARVSKTLRFTHLPTGATVCVLPVPKIHGAFSYITRWNFFSKRAAIKSLSSYLIMPLGLLTYELKRESCTQADTTAAITQIKEALKCSHSFSVVKLAVILALKIAKQWLRHNNILKLVIPT